MRFNLVFCWLAALALLFTGCISETVFLQDLNVSGLVKQPPLHVTEKNRKQGISISPWVSFNSQDLIDGQIAGHSKVSANGVFVVDTIRDNGNIVGFEEPQGVNVFPYSGKTIHWSLPTSAFGADVDVATSSSFAVSFGVSYGSSKGEGLWGGDAGLAYLFNGEAIAGRMEGGIQWQTLSYTAASVIVRTSSLFGTAQNSVAFFEDHGRISPIDFYGSFTLNTTMDMTVNYLLQVGVSRQRVAEFPPKQLSYLSPYFQFDVHDERVQNSTTFFIVSPGAYFTLTDASRLLLGGRIIFETEINDSNPGVLFMPVLKLDWKL